MAGFSTGGAGMGAGMRTGEQDSGMVEQESQDLYQVHCHEGG